MFDDYWNTATSMMPSASQIADSIPLNFDAKSMGLLNMSTQMLANSGPSTTPQGLLPALGTGLNGFSQAYDQFNTANKLKTGNYTTSDLYNLLHKQMFGGMNTDPQQYQPYKFF